MNGCTNQKPHKYGRSFNSDLIVQSFFAGQSWVAHNTMISNTILLWRPTIGCGLVIALVLVCKQLFTKQQQLLAICHIFDILQDVSYHPWYESFASIKKMHISFSEIDFSNFQDSKQWWLTLTLNTLDIFSSAKCQELFTQFLSSTDPRFQRAVDFLLTSYIYRFLPSPTSQCIVILHKLWYIYNVDLEINFGLIQFSICTKTFDIFRMLLRVIQSVILK